MKYLLWPLVIILVVGWILGFFVFKILGAIIHLLLILAAVLIVWNFISGRRST